MGRRANHGYHVFANRASPCCRKARFSDCVNGQSTFVHLGDAQCPVA